MKYVIYFVITMVAILFLVFVVLTNFMKVLKYLGSKCTIPLFGLFWDFIPVYDQFEFWVKPLLSGPIIACLPFSRKRARKC